MPRVPIGTATPAGPPAGQATSRRLSSAKSPMTDFIQGEALERQRPGPAALRSTSKNVIEPFAGGIVRTLVNALEAMKKTRVMVPWREGLHARAAAQLVQRIRDLRSRVRFRAGPRVADGSSILSLLTLCAPRDTAIEIEASGDDEDIAIHLIASLFADPKLCEDEDGGQNQPTRPEHACGARISTTSNPGWPGCLSSSPT